MHRLRSQHLILGLALVTPILVFGGGAETQLTSFQAVASADGVRVGVSAAAAPLTSQPADVGAPVAQALVNGLGTSQGYASMPYPGDAAVSLPGTLVPIVGSSIGVPLSPPSYPFLAASDAATRPEATASQPGVMLTARSDALSSRANAVAGGDAGANAIGRTAATALVAADTAGAQVTAESASVTDSVTVEGVLRLGRVRATAVVVAPAGGGAPRRESSFEVDGATIAGVTFGVTDKGIVLPGAGAPVPDTAGLNPVLDGAGITLTYLAPRVAEDSVVSAGLTVAEKQTLPSVGETVVTYTFGRARASASAAGSAVDVPVEGVDVPPVAAADPDLRRDAALNRPAPVAGSVPGPSPASPEVSSSPSATPVQPVALNNPSAASFYVVLVVGAVVAASGFVLIRLFGVRLAWTS